MILGISTFGIATRTALPAAGVLLVIGIFTLCYCNISISLNKIQLSLRFTSKI